MSKTKYLVTALLIGLVWVVPAKAQRRQAEDTLQLQRWEPHLSVSTGFLGTSWGDNRLYTSVAPSLTFRPNDRWAVNAGFRITSDMGFPGTLFSEPTRSLAPYKQQNGGTGLASAHVAAQYRVNDRLWLAAAVYRLSGRYAPMYGFGSGNTFDVSATAFSAAASYRFNNDSFLHFSFTYLRDEYGTMPYLYHDMWMHSGHGLMGWYGSPMDCYRMASPYGHLYMGGWY